MAYAAGLLGETREVGVMAADGGADGGGAMGEGVPSARSRRRATEHKRVSNGRMRALLLPEGLAYPTYREGLAQVLDADRRV